MRNLHLYVYNKFRTESVTLLQEWEDVVQIVQLCVYMLNELSLTIHLFIVESIGILTWKLHKGLMNFCSRHLDKWISIFLHFLSNNVL